VFLIPTAAMVVLMAMDKPGHSAIGLGVVLLGLPVYQLVFNRQQARRLQNLDVS
jgi:hypothetical protein